MDESCPTSFGRGLGRWRARTTTSATWTPRRFIHAPTHTYVGHLEEHSFFDPTSGASGAQIHVLDLQDVDVFDCREETPLVEGCFSFFHPFSISIGASGTKHRDTSTCDDVFHLNCAVDGEDACFTFVRSDVHCHVEGEEPHQTHVEDQTMHDHHPTKQALPTRDTCRCGTKRTIHHVGW